MVEDYQKALEQNFAYGYECYVFKHGIRGDQPRIPDGMPDYIDPFPVEFFVNPGCPPPPTSVEGKALEVHTVEKVKDPAEGVVVEEQG